MNSITAHLTQEAAITNLGKVTAAVEIDVSKDRTRLGELKLYAYITPIPGENRSLYDMVKPITTQREARVESIKSAEQLAELGGMLIALSAQVKDADARLRAVLTESETAPATSA